jgi:hypothetical protein
MKYLGAPQSGSQANTTASRNRAGQYYRNRRAPVQPVGTGRRAFIRQAFGASASGWAALSAINQASWNSYAAGHPVVDKLGQSITLTGMQMYVGIATQLRNCAQTPTLVPPVSASVFAAGAPTFTVVSAGAITFTPTGLGVAADFLLISFSPWVSGGVLFQKTFWQERKVAGNSVAAVVATTTYQTQFGVPPVGSRVFYKATPVNQYGVTGTPVIGFATAT